MQLTALTSALAGLQTAYVSYWRIIGGLVLGVAATAACGTIPHFCFLTPLSELPVLLLLYIVFTSLALVLEVILDPGRSPIVPSCSS